MLALAVAALLAISSPQDMPTNQLDQHADVVRQGILIDRTVRRNDNRAGSGSSDGRSTSREESARNSRARITCANNLEMVRRGSTDRRVHQLRALCERAGY